MQRSRAGVKTAGIAVAVRYLHAPSSVVAIKDIEKLYHMARGFLEKLGEESL
ncbi:MAG: hypothetical protein PHY23_09500 [Oscillospiraceae bacterium]|nr:hypothetical protein [Oscillospiraceae bacterium]